MLKAITLTLALALLTAQAPRKSFEEAQSEAAGQDVPSPGSTRDPFSRDWLEFQQLTSSWERLEDQLDDALHGVSTCDPQSAAAIGRVKDAAFKAIQAQSAYFSKWIAHASQNIQGFKQAMQSRTALKREIELSLAGVDRQKDELVERRRTLEFELRVSRTNSDGRELKALDNLIASADQRATNFRQALATWEDAGRSGTMTIDAADALKSRVAANLKLLESTTAIWQAYYNAAEARLSLKCWRDELQPQEPVIRKPSFVPGVR